MQRSNQPKTVAEDVGIKKHTEIHHDCMSKDRSIPENI